MQQLMFESSWDKAIAEQDRVKIEQSFSRQAPLIGESIHFVYDKKAVNYKQEILITTLIHNGTEEPLMIEDALINFVEGDQHLQGIFTVPCTIPAKSSMPWTFIFSETNSSESPKYHIVFENQM